MPKQAGVRKQSTGNCHFCGATFARGGMARHLASCAERMRLQEDADSRSGKRATLYTLQVRDQDSGDFWLFLEMRGDAKLKELDEYLRAIWLECCGHLSQFTAGGWRGNDVAMTRTADQVFGVAAELTHMYDFGTTSFTLIRPVAVREGIPLSNRSIVLMARNDPPAWKCIECGAPAEFLCSECIIEDDEWGTLCAEHAETHPHEDYGKPTRLANSPRMGMCGYDGPAEPPY